MKYHNHACASLLNPLSTEPLVWPSPWKFMSDLDPEAKTLLEAALAQANDAWERRIFSSQNEAAINKSSKQEMRVSGKQEVQKIATHHTYFCDIYIYLSISPYIYRHASLPNTYIYISVHIYLYLYLYTYMHISIHCVGIPIPMHISICIHTDTYTYRYRYNYTYT